MVHASVVRGLVLLSVISVAMTACAGGGPDGRSIPDDPSMASPATSPSLTVRTSPSPAGKNLVSASSSLAVVGAPYPLKLFTHCGIDQAAVDFDGSWWDLVPGSDEGKFSFAFTKGTMTLTLDDMAIFRAPPQGLATSATRARFVRHEGPIRLQGCY